MIRLSAFLVSIASAACAAASDVRPVGDLIGLDEASGTVAIICPTGNEGERFVSRGFAIGPNSSAPYDIVLAARHAAGNAATGALSACQVRAPGGEYVGIAEMRRAGAYLDEGDDWLVLRTAERLPESAVRFGLARAGPADINHLPGIVILSSRQGAQCDIRPDNVRLGEGRLFAHDCNTRPGHSGSPILISLNGEPTVIGVHIGRLMEFSTSEQFVLGVGRWIDASIEQAVMDLAQSAD